MTVADRLTHSAEEMIEEHGIEDTLMFLAALYEALGYKHGYLVDEPEEPASTIIYIHNERQ